MGAPLRLPLKLRLELLNSLSNAKEDFLKCLYKKESIVKRYLADKIDLHVHFPSSRGMYCAKFSGVGCPRPRGVDPILSMQLNTGELSVLIFIREESQGLRPVTPIVRLEALDCCEMSAIDADFPSLLFPTPELVLIAYDRKINELIRRGFGIQFGDLENQIFESRVQMIKDFAYADGDSVRGGNMDVRNAVPIAPSISIEIGESNLAVFPNQSGEQLPEVLKVFVCPKDPLRGAIERMRGHATISE